MVSLKDENPPTPGCSNVEEGNTDARHHDAETGKGVNDDVGASDGYFIAPVSVPQDLPYPYAMEKKSQLAYELLYILRPIEGHCDDIEIDDHTSATHGPEEKYCNGHAACGISSTCFVWFHCLATYDAPTTRPPHRRQVVAL